MDPLELGSIAAIVLVFFLWGPERLPELAKMVARARKEFDTATKEFQKVSGGILDGTSPFVKPTTSIATAATNAVNQFTKPSLPPPPSPVTGVAKTGDQLLIETARELGIQTNGKTREQIQQEIISMAKRPAAPPAAPAPQTEQKPADSAA